MAGLVQEHKEGAGCCAERMCFLSSLLFRGALRTTSGREQVQAGYCWLDASLSATVFADETFPRTNSACLAGANGSKTPSVGLQVDSSKDQEKVLILH